MMDPSKRMLVKLLALGLLHEYFASLEMSLKLTTIVAIAKQLYSVASRGRQGGVLDYSGVVIGTWVTIHSR